MSEKERLDVLLVDKGLFPSRERAKASIMAGLVSVDGKRIDKVGTQIPRNAQITLAGDSIGYVSRGGLKLAKALEKFNIDLTGKVMADVGASTGGFTDCALKHGAKKVFAVDVGYGQLAWSLRTDTRVINMERTNIRNITTEDIQEPLDFATIDVAFISLTKVLPVVQALLTASGAIVALIKPQFEAGREKVGKKGVVKDAAVHAEVIHHILTCAKNNRLETAGLTYSPIKGPEGNIEYLIYLINVHSTFIEFDEARVDEVVREAHARLNM
jgi:23S rRNA (cytidine1920-2'-O)/16S rRNA (cytidine1409-2'-O)-methyltransferase